ncbi:MAG: thiamine phosphate synthase [Gemmatimonadetes bacterium]|nr:thiamine phosphate synthase [Gemmatimonadota bacterium]
MSRDLRLLAIVDPSVLGGRDLVVAARAAAAGGATALQLRMKDAPAEELLRATERVLRAVPVPVYVNDRADVARVAGAAGVHVGQEDLPADLLRAWLPPPFRIGISVGSATEARAARPAGAAVDYWSVGPLYRTATKADAGAPLGPAGFRGLVQLAPRGMLVIGIGGITAATAGDVIAAGGAGIAVINAIFGAPDMQRAAREIRDAVDQALQGRETGAHGGKTGR